MIMTTATLFQDVIKCTAYCLCRMLKYAIHSGNHATLLPAVKIYFILLLSLKYLSNNEVTGRLLFSHHTVITTVC